MKTRLRGGTSFLIALGVAVAGPVAAQTSPGPSPAPIVVPTLPPTDPLTQAIVRAAAAALGDIISRERLNAANTTHGAVSYFHRYDMQVRTGPKSYRNVHLHPGTVIDPRGATPAAGTVVDVSGVGAADGSLDADTITVVR